MQVSNQIVMAASKTVNKNLLHQHCSKDVLEVWNSQCEARVLSLLQRIIATKDSQNAVILYGWTSRQIFIDLNKNVAL